MLLVLLRGFCKSKIHHQMGRFKCKSKKKQRKQTKLHFKWTMLPLNQFVIAHYSYWNSIKCLFTNTFHVWLYNAQFCMWLCCSYHNLWIKWSSNFFSFYVCYLTFFLLAINHIKKEKNKNTDNFIIILQEFIAVSQLNASVQGKILCFTGPPGLWCAYMYL